VSRLAGRQLGNGAEACGTRARFATIVAEKKRSRKPEHLRDESASDENSARLAGLVAVTERRLNTELARRDGSGSDRDGGRARSSGWIEDFATGSGLASLRYEIDACGASISDLGIKWIGDRM